MLAPRAHEYGNRKGLQGWFADVDVIDYGEPLRLLVGALVRGASVLIAPVRLAYFLNGYCHNQQQTTIVLFS